MKIGYYIFATLVFQALLYSSYYFSQKKKMVLTIIIVCLLWSPFIIGLKLWNVRDITDREFLILLLINGVIGLLSAVIAGLSKIIKISKSR